MIAVRSPEYPPTTQERGMTTKRRKIYRVELRLDATTKRALEALVALHGESLSQSEIIRDAIVEKAERDARSHKPKTTA